MINQAALTGRLTRDAELRYTQNGTAVASFTLAVDRQFTNRAGEREADFINCVIWRKSAENLASLTHKGVMIGVEGRIQTRTYDKDDGTRMYVTEVVVDNFALLESRAETEARPHAATGSAQAAASKATSDYAKHPTAPSTGQQAAKPGNAGDPFKATGKQLDISDDGLPF